MSIRRFRDAPWKQWASEVENQKTEPHCKFFAVADMMTMVLRMCGTLGSNSFISAQCLADNGTKNTKDLIRLCTIQGVETTDTYPYEGVTRSSYEPQVEKEQHYTIDDIDIETEDIKQELMDHFSGPRPYPCVGSLKVGRLNRRGAHETQPYRHPEGLEDLGMGHAVVIVGVEPDGDSLCCHIKNSWGRKWARDGYDDVGFEVFDYVLIPFHNSGQPL